MNYHKRAVEHQLLKHFTTNTAHSNDKTHNNHSDLKYDRFTSSKGLDCQEDFAITCASGFLMNSFAKLTTTHCIHVWLCANSSAMTQ